MVRLNSMGRCQTQIVGEARTFFEQRFALNSEEASDRAIQRQLVDWRGGKQDGEIAETCLRCFISNQLKEFCLALEQKFGQDRDFSAEDLLALVLVDGDMGTGRGGDKGESSNVNGLMTRILETFDPEKSNLSTWTVRVAKSDRAVKRFLLERGIEHITEWLLLVQVTPGGLHRILATFERTDAEIARSLQLLEQFQQIYRTELLQHRQPGTRAGYPKPTEDQLQRIAQRLTPAPSPQKVLLELQNLAQLLREDRLRRQGIPLPSDESFDVPHIQKQIDRDVQTEDEQSDFLKEYRQQFDTCLQRAVQTTIENRIASFQQGKSTPKRQQKAKEKTQQFLTGLQLLYCQCLSMGEIAPHIGLKDQPRVSRLLELDNLRSDLTRNTLSCLKECVLKLARYYADPNQLRNLSAKIDGLLEEEIGREINKDKKEAHGARNRFTNSQLALNICQYLNRRKESHE